MEELLNQILADGLTPFRGMKLIGTVPLRDGIINDVVQEFLQQQRDSKSTNSSATASSTPVGPPPLPGNLTPQDLLPYLDLRIESMEGMVLVHFSLHVE